MLSEVERTVGKTSKMSWPRQRPLGSAILCLTLVVLSWSLPTANAVKATQLILGRSPTTTTAPEPDPSAPGSDGVPTAEETTNEPKVNLTGIPQIDYIYDPNLPRELNGYNLSHYPFYESVPKPETMDFKCDGLHDGFYASVPHKCQVYHHCLFGTRYDFLCANYTAFDQKTFICHFVSEVDCKNSPMYFSRNEALYKTPGEGSTTTSSTTTTTTTTTTTERPQRPGRRRPHPRFDYYDDDDYYFDRDDYEFEERGRRRPRPRPQGPGGKRRPYSDYDDEGYNRRPRPTDEDLEDRRQYDRPRNGKRPAYQDQRRTYDEEDDRRPGYRNGKRRPGRPKDNDDRIRSDDEESRPRSAGLRRDDDTNFNDDGRSNDNVEGSVSKDVMDQKIETAPTDAPIPAANKQEDSNLYDKTTRDQIKDQTQSPDETRLRDDIRQRSRLRDGFIRNRGETKTRPDIRPRDDIAPKEESSSNDEVAYNEDGNLSELKSKSETRPRDEIRYRDGPRSREPIRYRDEKTPKDDIRSNVQGPRDDSGLRYKDIKRPRENPRYRDSARNRDETDSDRETNVRDDIRLQDDRKSSRDDTGVLETTQNGNTRQREDRYPLNEGRRYRDERPYRNRDKSDRINNRPERNYESEDKMSDVSRDERPYRMRNERDRPSIKPNLNENQEKVTETKQTTAAPEIQVSKPGAHSIFSQPRAPPKISRPVPNNEKHKYSYVTAATTKAPPKTSDDDYYDEYEDDISKPSSSGKYSTVQQRPKSQPVEKEKFKPSRPQNPSSTGQKNKKRIPFYDDDDYYYDVPLKNDKYIHNQRNRESTPLKPKVYDEEYYDYEPKSDKKQQDYPRDFESETVSKIKETRPNVKVVKRPFLPSRGGSPYLPRGLKPVAGKDLREPAYTTPKPTTTTSTTTTTTTTTTTPKPIITTTTKSPSTTTVEKASEKLKDEEDYSAEYYDEEDIDYDPKNVKNPSNIETNVPPKVNSDVSDFKPSIATTTTTPTPTTSTTEKIITTTEQVVTPEQKAKFVAAKVLRVYNDNYEAIRKKLETTAAPGEYLKPYLATGRTFIDDDDYEKKYAENEATYQPEVDVRSELSKPYVSTDSQLRKIPDNISIKQNLADSIESEYDERVNEALIPSQVHLRNIPTGFVAPSERGYTRFQNYNVDPQFAASDSKFSASDNHRLRRRPEIPGVSIRTPTSYFIQPQRISNQSPNRFFRHITDLF